jgi:hypothetical protein
VCAKFLEKNHHVRLIELNKQRVKKIADELENTLIFSAYPKVFIAILQAFQYRRYQVLLPAYNGL